MKTRRWLGSPTYSLEEVRWLLGDPGFRVGGCLNLRGRQKLSMEGLRGDGGEGQLGGREKTPEGVGFKNTFHED